MASQYSLSSACCSRLNSRAFLCSSSVGPKACSSVLGLRATDSGIASSERFWNLAYEAPQRAAASMYSFAFARSPPWLQPISATTEQGSYFLTSTTGEAPPRAYTWRQIPLSSDLASRDCTGDTPKPSLTSPSACLGISSSAERGQALRRPQSPWRARSNSTCRSGHRKASSEEASHAYQRGGRRRCPPPS